MCISFMESTIVLETRGILDTKLIDRLAEDTKERLIDFGFGWQLNSAEILWMETETQERQEHERQVRQELVSHLQSVITFAARMAFHRLLGSVSA